MLLPSLLIVRTWTRINPRDLARRYSQHMGTWEAKMVDWDCMYEFLDIPVHD